MHSNTQWQGINTVNYGTQQRVSDKMAAMETDNQNMGIPTEHYSSQSDSYSNQEYSQVIYSAC